MTGKYYVLDVNVIRHSAELCDEKDSSTYTVLKSIIDLIFYCNCFIVTREILKEYNIHLQKAMRSGNTMIKSLCELLSKTIHSKEKFRIFNGQLFDKISDDKLPKGDKKLVQLSRVTKASIITSDKKLIEILSPNDECFSSVFEVKIYTPVEIIQKLDNDTTKMKCN